MIPVALRLSSCPSTSQCSVVGNTTVETFNPSRTGCYCAEAVGLQGGSVSCPPISQCTVVDRGQQVTFAPGSSSAPAPVTLQSAPFPAGLLAIDCPSVSQCTAIDGPGNTSPREITFNPRSPGRPAAVALPITESTAGRGRNFQGISCPSVSQCTVVGDDAAEVTFDPRSPDHMLRASLGESAAANISCPSVTRCSATAFGRDGVITFNPRVPSRRRFASIGRTYEMACSSPTQCTALNGYGVAITFNPVSPRSRLRQHIKGRTSSSTVSTSPGPRAPCLARRETNALPS